jgi:hypothetical protein
LSVLDPGLAPRSRLHRQYRRCIYESWAKKMRKQWPIRMDDDEIELFKQAVTVSGGKKPGTRAREVLLWWAEMTLGPEKTEDLPPTPTIQ